MRRSGTIVGVAVVLTLAAIVWFWSTPPRPRKAAGQASPKTPTVAAQRRASVIGGAPRSAAGLKLDPRTNVEPDLPPAAERQKNAWGKVAREVQEMNERDHERFKAALTSWVAVPANKALLEQVQQLNKEFADLPPDEQERRFPLAEALYAEGMATLRQHYADTPAGLPATK
jgi:hypothetical protein